MEYLQMAKEIIAIGNEDIGIKFRKQFKNITEYENQYLKIVI